MPDSIPLQALQAVRIAALLSAAAFGLLARAQPATPDIATLTASEAVQRLCAGSLTSEQLVTAYFAQAKARMQLNAFITLDEAGALRAARAADAARKRGGACKPLAGLPVVIKDNIQVRGLPATAGTPALKNFVPTADAPVVAKLRAAGAIVLGKTHMHELAFGVTGYNPAFQSGPEVGVRNAYDTTRVAGGSSSGNGAALGARMRRPRSAPTPAARCAFRAPSTAAPRCARRSGAIRSGASRRSRTHATRQARWRLPCPMSHCSIGSSPAARRSGRPT